MSRSGSEPPDVTLGAPPVDQELFRDVIGHFASGVTIVTTASEGMDLGTTASAVSSLSMDPPMMLICMNRTSETGSAIARSGRFAVNILGEDQAAAAKHFATKGKDKFAGVALERGIAGVPLLGGALACLECHVAEAVSGGTHTVFLANVDRASAGEGRPLTYYRGRFGYFEDAAQELAYRVVRRLVISRTRDIGSALDVEQLATELDLERPRVQYALLKLDADGLVERGDDGGYRVRPLDIRAASEAIDARCAIEVAVADEAVGRIPAAELAALRTHAEAAARAVAGERPDYDALRRSGGAFHRTFVSLTGNGTLVELFERLRIDATWARLLRGRHLSPAYLLELTDACAAGDREAAKALLRTHAADARDVVREVIAEAGGAV